mmetsp:Transcript_32783/g.45522  ORF Transcript_32783/g.45522 Transcript_32783/m.45522 type:complete len:200 (+) Transcript_32783:1640-2239(+)
MSGECFFMKCFVWAMMRALYRESAAHGRRPGESMMRTGMPYTSPLISRTCSVSPSKGAASATGESKMELIVDVLPTPVLPKSRMVHSKPSGSAVAGSSSARVASALAASKAALLPPGIPRGRPALRCSANSKRYRTCATTVFLGPWPRRLERRSNLTRISCSLRFSSSCSGVIGGVGVTEAAGVGLAAGRAAGGAKLTT